MRMRRLKNCRPGLFLFTHNRGTSDAFDTLCVKTEYGQDAYVVSSGEFFHGGAKTKEERADLRVLEITYGEAMDALSAAGIKGDHG